MKTNTIKHTILAIITCFMSLTVVMSAAHAKDVVKDPSHDSGVIGRTVDPVAKSLGDLHNHIDKQTLKSISMDSPMTVRQREIKALNDDMQDRSIVQIIEEMIGFYRLIFAVRFSYTFAS